ncbi:MAG: polysaccharide deacetylase family protein [Pseudomonadota bacterium]
MPPHMGNLTARLRIGLKEALLGIGFPTRALGRFDQSIILFYHAIGEGGVPARAFEQQLRYLKRHFELIFASEIDTPSTTGRLRVAITFDDGLKNTRDVALPVLQKLGVKATLFALPGDVSWLWTAEMRERLEGAIAEGTVIVTLPPLRDGSDINRVIEQMKTMSHDDLVATIARIRDATSFAPSAAWRAEHELMNAEELRALPADLIEIGAHTLTHPILTHVDDDWLEREIVEGKRRLETALQRPVTTFSYPNGAFDRRCLEIAGRHYDYAFTTETAIGDFDDQQALKGHKQAVNRLHGVDHQAEMPLRMLRFLRAGHGFSTRPPAGPAAAAVDDQKETPGYEMPAVMQK